MVATATGFVLGAIIGAVATMAGSYFVYWRRTRARTRRVRSAFRREIEALDYVAELAERGDYEQLTAAVEKPVVYETNAGDVGYLSAEEVDALIDFYTGLYWLRDQEDIEDKKERVHEVVEAREAALAALESGRR